MGPSAIDIEVRSMSPEMSDGITLLKKFLNFILFMMTARTNFELANAYLALALKIHSDIISKENDLIFVLEQIKEIQSLAWSGLKLSINKNVCLVNYLKSVV